MSVCVWKINEEEEFKKKVVQLIEEATGGRATMVKVSLLSGNAMVLVDNKAKTSVWFCRDMGNKIIGTRILAGKGANIISSELVNRKERHGLDICIDLQCVTYVDCSSVVTVPSPEKGMVRVTLFKSVKSLLEDFLKEE